jgi:uncharacterized delta-60 repeat protein
MISAMADFTIRSLGVRFLALSFALLAVAAVLASVARAAPGELDPTFGVGGSERLFQNPENTFFRAVATQPDGKIVMVGGGDAGKVLVARLLENGGLDPSFGNSGVVSTGAFPGSFPSADAVAVQPDGKIVIAGSAEVAGIEDFLVARFLPGGQLDPSFGGGEGFVTFPVAAERNAALALAIGAGGNILLTGRARTSALKEVVAVAVLLPEGGLDPSFGTDGVTTVESSVGDDEGDAIAEAPGGDIVIADEAGPGGGSGFTIVKLLPSGALDPGFGTAGIAQTPIPSSGEGRSVGVAVMPDGRIVASGYGYDGPEEKFAAVRYLADGELDHTFGDGTGIFSKKLGGGDEAADFVAVTPKGEVLLAGFYQPAGGRTSPAVVRLSPAGTLDPSFGSGGLVKRSGLTPFDDEFVAATLDGRERLVMLSEVEEGDETTSFEVTRILGHTPPPSPATHAPAPAVVGPPAPRGRKPPRARIKGLGKTVDVARLKRFSGTAADPEGEHLGKVQIALVRKAPSRPKVHATAAAVKKNTGRSCLDLRSAKGGFKAVRAKRGASCPLRWLDAKGTSKWSFRLTGTLPVGSYVLYARAIDAKGLAESSFSAAAGDRVAFRLVRH